MIPIIDESEIERKYKSNLVKMAIMWSTTSFTSYLLCFMNKYLEGSIYQNNYLNQGCQGSERALSFYEAIPKSWSLSCEDTYPEAIIDLKVGRERALLAYKSLKSADNEKFS